MSPSPLIQQLVERFYVHTRRPEWGIAVQAWEQDGKRGYQFSDGQLRVLKEGFYSLMSEVEPPDDEDILARLRETSSVSGQKSQEVKALEPVCSFETQIKIFKILYPEGFKGESWRQTYRGEGSARPLKRHRNHVLERAKGILGAEALAEGDAAEQSAGMVSLFGQTSLVSNKSVNLLKKRLEGREDTFVQAITALLHGEGDQMKRFGQWLKVLRDVVGEEPDWTLATAPLTLVYSGEEVCVSSTAFKKQAGSIAPRLIYSNKAERISYRNFRKVAHDVRDRLKAEGLEPADLIDIHDFIELTLKPSVLKKHGD